MKRQSLLILVTTACALMAIIYLGRLVFESASYYDRALLIAGGWTKLLALVVAALFAIRSTVLLGGGNPARVPWGMLSGGLGALALGQATLVYFQTFRQISPFPSIADVWFVIAYPLLIAGVIAFIVAYARSGFPMRGTGVMFVLLGAAAVAGAWPILRPIVHSGDALLPKTLNVLYPALDLVLLVPVIVLLVITSRFRGGAVWHIWCAMLAGFVFTAVGDILFAYFSTLGLSSLDPAVHAMYLVAYGGLAGGAMEQRRLLAA
jgi:hypothetical protein